MSIDYVEFLTKFEQLFGDEWIFIYQQNKQRLCLKNQRIATTKLATIIPAVFRISKNQGFRGMTVRDLSLETDISMGGLYKYFSNKEDLMIMIHRALVAMTEQLLLSEQAPNPLLAIDKLLVFHLFISERLKKWFYFVFMEAKHLEKPLLNQFVKSEQLMEQALIVHIETSQQLNLCQCDNPFLTATIFKAVLQEWYLKSHKYQSNHIQLEQYKQHLLNLRRQLLPELTP